MSAPFHILLVEDEPVIRELVSSMLTEDGVTVDCAADGAEGLKLARAKAYDLVLLDVVLPKLDGITTLRMLKADELTRSAPVYMLTARTKKADVATAMSAGAEGYIQKPFRGAELMDLVVRLRSKRR